MSDRSPMQRLLVRRAGHGDGLVGHRRVPAKLLGDLGGRVAQHEAGLARDQLAGLEAVVVDHRPHRGLQPFEHTARVGYALVEVVAAAVIGRRRELRHEIDVGGQRCDLPGEVVQEVRQPVPPLDDLALLRALPPVSLFVERARAQQRPEAGPPLLHVRRRREDRVGAGGQRVDAEAAQIRQRADDHRHEVRAHVVLETRAEIDGSRRWRPVVDQNDVGRVQQRLFECGVRVVRRADDQTLRAQERHQRPRDSSIWGDDQSIGLAGERQLVALRRPLVREHLEQARDHHRAAADFQLSPPSVERLAGGPKPRWRWLSYMYVF